MITSIEIDGYKTLRNFKMELKPGLNVLVGKNGSGKSAVMEVLGLVGEMIVRRSTTWLPEERLLEGVDENSAFKVIIHGKIFNDSDEHNYKFEFNYFGTGLQGGFSYGLYDNSNTLYAGLLNSDVNINNVYQFVKIAWQDLHIFVSNFNPSFIRKRQILNKVPVYDKTGGDILSMLHVAFANTMVDTKSRAVINFNDMLLMLDNKVHDWELIQMRGSQDLDLILKYTAWPNKELNIKSLSEGSAIWIAINTWLLYSSEPHLCFDEPDNYLYPRFSNLLPEYFREYAEKSNKWVLCSSHNESFLNRCRPEEIIIMKLENGVSRAVRMTDAQEAYQSFLAGDGQVGFHLQNGVLDILYE